MAILTNDRRAVRVFALRDHAREAATDKIQRLLCARRTRRLSEVKPVRIAPEIAQNACIRAKVFNATGIRHNVVIFGTSDRAEAVRRLARFFFRVSPGQPFEVEWL